MRLCDQNRPIDREKTGQTTGPKGAKDNMKMIQQTMRKSGQKALSPTPKMIDLGTWGRFQTYPLPENIKLPRRFSSGGGGRLLVVCDHCLQPFKTNRRNQRFCKPGCRTYNNRLKHAGIVAWLEGRGMTYDTANDLMETKGLTALSETMHKAGWEWTGQEWRQR